MTITNAKPPNEPSDDAQHAQPIIFAPASAPGASGVAVMRLSGSHLAPVLTALGIATPLKPRHATLCTLINQATGEPIDQALAIYFPAPNSFTGEEVLELHTHGGSAVRNALIQCLSALPNCRFAQPGEFSKRAFYNHKMDLLQAEGIADLIAAETSAQHQLALSQLGGEMSQKYEALRQNAVRALALLEAYIDFPDEEIPQSTIDQVNQLVSDLHRRIEALLEHDIAGEIIRDGFSVAIIGPPNAGKSSLMNALAKRDVAIVSDIAGTTRDQIEVHLNIGDYFVRLIDTAGIRESADVIESEGIRRAIQSAQNADLKLAVFDIISDTELDVDTLNLIGEDDLILLNKSDKVSRETSNIHTPSETLHISANNGDGLDSLMKNIAQRIERKMQNCPAPALTRARHREALHEAMKPLTHFHAELPLELACEELRQAAFSIGKITGKIEIDQLLDVIFREFCIGK